MKRREFTELGTVDVLSRAGYETPVIVWFDDRL